MIDFAFQLLHVAMRDVLVAWILLIAFAILLFKPGLGIGDFLVYVLDYSVDVLPLANLNEDTPLEVKHAPLNEVMMPLPVAPEVVLLLIPVAWTVPDVAARVDLGKVVPLGPTCRQNVKIVCCKPC